jgi:trk/ktr system potassium uptake protein
MRIRVVLGVVGNMLRLFAPAFLAPLLMALRDGLFDKHWQWAPDGDELLETMRFLLAMGVTFLVGTALARKPEGRMVFRRSEALAVVAFTWALVAAAAALPYFFDGVAPVDAYFEAVSGLTTTGATILSDWDRSRAFFLWRAMTQWFGGIGVIALFVVVLPRLGIAGRQIFFAEASTAPSEAVSPSVRQSARKLWGFYIALTLLLVFLLIGAGFNVYEAFVHSFTTLSAGGFSPNPESIFGYHNDAVVWVMTPFMFLAGSSYPLMWRAFSHKPSVLLRDGELRLYTGVAMTSMLALAAVLAGGIPTLDHIRDSAFQIASLISSAGFASVDYDLWSPAAKAILVVVMILGGCAGSAAGGAKEVRFLLVFKFIKRELTRVLHPSAVLPIRHGGESVPNRVMWAIFLLVLLYFLGYGAVATAVALLENGQPTGTLDVSFAAAVACLSNVGPAFGPAGPMGSYADFRPVTKVLLTLTMLIGRLEIVTALALLHPHVWKKLSWSGVRARP